MPSTKSTKRPNLPRTPSPAWLAKEYADLLSRPNVIGCFIGRKKKQGRATRRLSVICAVREKVDLKDLDPQTERVPEEILWRRGKARPGRLSTDVQVLSGPFRPASGEVAGPGDGVFAGTGQATIGIALQHPTLGDVVTTAGHLVLDGAGTSSPNLAVQLADTAGGTQHAGSVLKAVRSEIADYALVRPADLPCENLFADQTPIALPFTPSAEEIGAPLFVLSARGVLSTTFRGVHGLLPVGDILMQDLLLTDFETKRGDSGGCLVDVQSRAWGLLVGFSELDGTLYSVFMSAALPLALEGATFL